MFYNLATGDTETHVLIECSNRPENCYPHFTSMFNGANDWAAVAAVESEEEKKIK